MDRRRLATEHRTGQLVDGVFQRERSSSSNRQRRSVSRCSIGSSVNASLQSSLSRSLLFPTSDGLSVFGNSSSGTGFRKSSQTHRLDLVESRIAEPIASHRPSGVSLVLQSDIEHGRIRTLGRRSGGALGSGRTDSLRLLQTEHGPELRAGNERNHRPDLLHLRHGSGPSMAR